MFVSSQYFNSGKLQVDFFLRKKKKTLSNVCSKSNIFFSMQVIYRGRKIRRVRVRARKVDNAKQTQHDEIAFTFNPKKDDFFLGAWYLLQNRCTKDTTNIRLGLVVLERHQSSRMAISRSYPRHLVKSKFDLCHFDTLYLIIAYISNKRTYLVALDCLSFAYYNNPPHQHSKNAFLVICLFNIVYIQYTT